jgi:hypothetical protein
MTEKLDIHTKINNMIAELPEPVPGDSRRSHTLSKLDARWMANMMLLITESGGCNRGLSEQQASALQEMEPETLRSLANIVKERRRILALIGTAVMASLVYIGQKVLNVLDSSFWKAIFTSAAKQ